MPTIQQSLKKILDRDCQHNTMIERKNDTDHAWQCADCGYVYGTPNFQDACAAILATPDDTWNGEDIGPVDYSYRRGLRDGYNSALCDVRSILKQHGIKESRHD